MRGLLPTPYLASGAALGTTKETGDRYRPLLRTHCEKFARGRCISADLRNTQELKGIRAEKPLRERGVIILFAEAGWGLFDRIGNTIRALASDNATVVIGTSLNPDMSDELRVTVVATGIGMDKSPESGTS